eukprot:TRINITY_DN16113_c0_g1_i1.p1 TRINITY_DN16113_c0_g1~~TRINITY_DN16113_c0_g1_i1.p1  ORF type:complete len:144 (-),score=56.90 TRINITY_DN16113_c0_g1_i1:5-436(-)
MAEHTPEQQASLRAAVHDMFGNVSEYIQGELEVSSQDYQLLERMNLASADKYRDLADHAENLLAARETMLQKYDEFMPYIFQIDELDKTMGTLEKTVEQLVEYTRRLEDKFKACLLYTSDAADDLLCVALGCTRIIKKKMYYE